MIQMIIMDLDGTLLKSDKSISNYSISILEECKRKGIKIAIATARSEKAAERSLMLIKPNIMILNGGALVKKDDGQIIYKKLLSKDTSDGIIKDCIHSDNIGDFTVETEENYFVSYKDKSNHPDYMHGIYYNFNKPLFKETYKITVEIFSENTASEISKKYKECDIIKFTEENWYRFAHREAGKAQAIEKITLSEKIDIKKIVSFGDDYNDIGMIEKCGIGIAMENGIDEIKKVSKYICGKNDEDGVAKWIKKNILIE